MSRSERRLTERQVKNWKPGIPITSDNPTEQEKLNSLTTLNDGGGLIYVYDRKSGRKVWRFRSKRKMFGKSGLLMTIKGSESMSLKEIRRIGKIYQNWINEGKDPREEIERQIQEKLQKKYRTQKFKTVSDEWYELYKKTWTEPTQEFYRRILEKYVNVYLGSIPIQDIKVKDISNMLEGMYKKGLTKIIRETSSITSRIFRYGISKEYNITNPVDRVPKGEFTKYSVTSFRSLPLEDLTEYFQKIEDEKNRLTVSTYYGLQIIVYIFPRLGELLNSQWTDIDFQKKTWTIPWERMKMGRKKIDPDKNDHRIYLSDTVIQLLKDLKRDQEKMDETRKIKLSDSEYIFPTYSRVQRKIIPQSKTSFQYFIERTGLQKKMTFHGFRSLGVTTLSEKNVSYDVLELLLSHHKKNPYHRGQMFKERKKSYLMYSDIVDSYRQKVIKPGASQNRITDDSIHYDIEKTHPKNLDGFF